MHSITISGNVGKDAELRTVRDKPVLNFNVGVKNGYGRDAGTIWYRCALWGNAANAFEPYIKKGTKVFIVGDLKHDEYEGKPQYNVDVKLIDTGGAKGGEQSGGGGGFAGGNAQKQDAGFADDLDDDVPFIHYNSIA